MQSFLLIVLSFVLGGLVMGLGWWLARLVSRGGASIPCAIFPIFDIAGCLYPWAWRLYSCRSSSQARCRSMRVIR